MKMSGRRDSAFRLILAGTLVLGVTATSVSGSDKDGDSDDSFRIKQEILLSQPASKHLRHGLVRSGHYLGKADTSLRRLDAEYRQYKRSGSSRDFKPGSSHVQFKDGRIMVVAIAHDDGAQLEADLKQVGLEQADRFKSHVAGMLPIEQIATAASLDSLRSISVAYPAIRSIGAVTSQGDVALRADLARANHGVDGTGVMVGVMSDTYDQATTFPSTTAADDIASGDLPPGNPVIPGGDFEGCGPPPFGTPCTDEGRAMLQIIHDLAPGAGLLFHTALNNQVRFASGIGDLVAAGADIIVDDLAYPDEPMFMDGIIAQAVNSAHSAGVSYFSAAGNAARNSWEGGFEDSGEILCIEIIPDGICDPIFEEVGPMHDFDPGPGIDTVQSITIPVNQSIIVGLQWEDPFGNVQTGNGPLRDHDIALLSPNGDTFYEIGGADNVLNGSPTEVLVYTNISGQENFGISITYDPTDSIDVPSGFLKMVIFATSGVTINEYQTSSSTIVGHANAGGANATGAAYFGDTPEFGQTPPLREAFSSAGGTPILFDTSGTALGFPVIREKPDFTAVDGVSNTFFGTPDVNGDGFPDFFGTSAAAPHAAAVAALMLDANPALSPANINALLRTNAIDMDAAGFDFESGYGLVDADAAVAMSLSVEGCVAGSQAIPSEQWHAFSLPCDVMPDEAVTAVFPGLDPAGYGTDWEVRRYDSASQSEVVLAADDPIGQSTGYWVFTDLETSIGVDGFAFPHSDIPLVTDPVEGRLNHLGVAQSGSVPWADVEVIDGAQVLSLDQADPLDGSALECSQDPVGPNCRMSRIMYQWTGSSYQAFDGVTPGMEGSLDPYAAFVVNAIKPGIQLRIPPAASAPLSAADGTTFPDGWQVRLIAGSGSMQDSGNVIGQLDTAQNGRDHHDLEELAPFGDRHLSILFTNPEFPSVEWGFTSDFHAPGIKPSGEWPFVVRASDNVGEVTLSWEGDAELLNSAWLIDMETGEYIRPAPGTSYSYVNGPADREFVFAIYQR